MRSIRLLNYELAPSPATIFGCLLPAPWLGMLAGLLLALAPGWNMADGLPSRFAPLTLAITHGLVLGMLAPVMIGALFQLMPVVGGQTVAAARWLAAFIAPVSLLIALSLGAGFLFGMSRGFMLAAILASLLYGSVVLALLHTGLRIMVTDASTRTLRYIALALGMVIACGVALAGSFAGWWQLDVLHWLNLHVAWGLVGWIASLLLAVASTVVPMFWQSRRPGIWWQRSLPWCLWLFLLLMIIPSLQAMAILLACLLLLGFASLGLHAIWYARRRFDPAWILWLVAALSCVGACSMTIILILFAAHIQPAWLTGLQWCTGVLALVGGAVLPVNAMLGKIIPFLVFLHLRKQTPAGQRVPTMQEILPPRRLQLQARMLLLALLLLFLLPLAPNFLAVAAGLAFAISQGMLASFLMLALLRYRSELQKLLFRKTS
ncbi:hypothetical protein [Undibacterium sp.]|uniref:hypothetical protein n=1 Tax=Undibacterium sp. TaxID=1914977 RepID=UPI002731773E|nr:hypothetical protein [Undibacterium sp.]MDP1977447.1 hypothetical protein [Undibacterium sp.]